MDKFFKRLFDKIAAFHQEQAHLSASIAETKLHPEVQKMMKDDWLVKNFIWIHKEDMPQA